MNERPGWPTPNPVTPHPSPSAPAGPGGGDVREMADLMERYAALTALAPRPEWLRQVHVRIDPGAQAHPGPWLPHGRWPAGAPGRRGRVPRECRRGLWRGSLPGHRSSPGDGAGAAGRAVGHGRRCRWRPRGRVDRRADRATSRWPEPHPAGRDAPDSTHASPWRRDRSAGASSSGCRRRHPRPRRHTRPRRPSSMPGRHRRGTGATSAGRPRPSRA